MGRGYKRKRKTGAGPKNTVISERRQRIGLPAPECERVEHNFQWRPQGQS